MATGITKTERSPIKKRKATRANPWHYTGCGLDNVYLVGIEVRTDPATAREQAAIPMMRDLHDCIFLELISKQGLLTGKEVRFLRRHLYWTQEGAAQKIKASSAQHFSKWERKGENPAFDIWTDFTWRMLCVKAFISKPSQRKAEANRILKSLENVETVLESLRADRKPQIIEIQRIDSDWLAPGELLTA